ncbi:MAG: Mur ligase domain-containing protein, partial [Clostridiales bacterium]|nr:Mur ligase domain-containing protein [Clostridiales bacterium]
MKLTLRQVAEWVNGELHGGKAARETYIYGVGTDSREDLSGRLFIPLIGERFDGHNFIAEAFRRGAVCCLTERDIKQHNNFKIKVLSVREAMLRLAERYKASVGVKSAAITGSVGKT